MKELLLSIILSFILIPVTLACSCLYPGTPLEELEKSDAVFSGKVINLEQIGEQPTGHIKATFQIQEKWKLPANTDIINVKTPLSSSACGFNFEKNKEYLVYAYSSDNGEYSTSICSRTKKLSDAAEDLNELNKNKKPEEGDSCYFDPGIRCSGNWIQLCATDVGWINDEFCENGCNPETFRCDKGEVFIGKYFLRSGDNVIVEDKTIEIKEVYLNGDVYISIDDFGKRVDPRHSIESSGIIAEVVETFYDPEQKQQTANIKIYSVGEDITEPKNVGKTFLEKLIAWFSKLFG